MKYILVIMSILLLAVAGCGGGSDKEQTSTGARFIGGTQGLDISFAEGSLPDTVMDTEQSFAVSLIVENVGEHTIENGGDITASITGIDPADFGVSAGDLTQSPDMGLRAAQVDATGGTIEGETTSLEFPANGGVFQHQKEIAGSVQYNVRADVCYKYGTVANTKICILEDMLGTRGGDKICEINQVKTIENSGGPVQVSEFRESVSSQNKVAFVFKLNHAGSGKVHELGSGCSDDFQQRDKVHVKVDTGLSDGLSCSGLQNGVASGSVYEGDATLLNGVREVRCTQTVNSPTDIEKLVRVDLTYDYKQYIQKTVTVQHVGG